MRSADCSTTPQPRILLVEQEKLVQQRATIPSQVSVRKQLVAVVFIADREAY